jgi:TatD DNase family protein
MSLVPPPLEPLIDTHAHLDDPRLSNDLAGVLRRARSAGLLQIVAIGTTADDSEATVGLAARNPGVFAAVGVQPNHVAEARADDWARIVELSSRPGVVAIGETGLDRHWDFTPFDQQREWFGRHIELARERDLPLVIHCRECEADVLEQLDAHGGKVRGVLHSFTGGREHAQAFLERGLHISFAGMVTFSTRKLDGLREAAGRIPEERILVETDSPYLSPQPLRGRPNQPSHLAWTARFLAELRGVDPLDFAQTTTANARGLFRLPLDRVLTG